MHMIVPYNVPLCGGQAQLDTEESSFNTSISLSAWMYATTDKNINADILNIIMFKALFTVVGVTWQMLWRLQK